MNFWIEDGGVKLNTRLEMPENKNGSVPLVILIHGLTGHMNEPHLIALKDALVSEGFGVLRAEMYGHGNSGGKFADHNLYRWIDNTLAVIDYARNIKGVSDLYLAGLNDREIAERLGCCVSSVWRWRTKYELFPNGTVGNRKKGETIDETQGTDEPVQ